MHVLLFGASGMVGKGVLLECLDSPDVSSVVSVARNTLGVVHPKLTEVISTDFDLSTLTTARDQIARCDVAMYCVGVTSVGMNEEAYTAITYTLTMVAAQSFFALNPSATFLFVSGENTDANGSAMWARVKGRTEDDIMKMGFRDAYMFRPGFIQPKRGIRSRTRMYNVLYAFAAPLVPLIRTVFPDFVTTTENVGRAMIRVAAHGAPTKILRTPDINRIARAS